MSNIGHLAASAASFHVNAHSANFKNPANDLIERFELPQRTSAKERSDTAQKTNADRRDDKIDYHGKSDNSQQESNHVSSEHRAEKENVLSPKTNKSEKRKSDTNDASGKVDHRSQKKLDKNSDVSAENAAAFASADAMIKELEAILSNSDLALSDKNISTSVDAAEHLDMLNSGLFDLELFNEMTGLDLSEDELQALVLQNPILVADQGKMAVLMNQNQTMSNAAQMLDSLQKVTARLTNDPMSDKTIETNSDELLGKQAMDISKGSLELLAKQKQNMADLGQSMHQSSHDANGSAMRTDSLAIKMDGVEVLETKNFAPVSQNISNNGANLVDALARTQAVNSVSAIEQIDTLQNMPQTKVLSTMKLQLKPAELGLVTAIMKMQGEVLQVDLKVENVEAFRQLNDDSSAIAKALKGHGFAIEQVNVQLSLNGDKGQNQPGQQGQQNGQTFQQQADAEHMQNSGQSKDERTGSRGGFENDDDMLGSALEVGRNSDSVQRDGVYL